MSSADFQQKRKTIQTIELERKKLLGVLIDDEEMIEGSLTDILVKCGREGCHCEKQPVHMVTRLTTRENGQIKLRVVRVDDRERVRDLVQVHKDFKQALKELGALESRQKKILKTMKKARNKIYS
jgi:hypothetical protein